jgi:PUA domain protein
MKQISEEWKIELPKIKNLRLHHISDNEVIITGDGITAIKIDDKIIPHLSEIELLKKFPYIVVDMGAIKFVCKGANIMRPGITKLTDFNDGEIVCVVEESNNKFLSVGIAMMASDEASSTKTGMVIENLHYVSDKFWETRKEIND